jgi:hypothetical protein
MKVGNRMVFLDKGASLAAIAAVLSFSSSSVLAAPPPREGCRAVSKIEYESAKREYLLISRSRVYVQTGHFWRHHYWHCPV